jgi:hypothetical protein
LYYPGQGPQTGEGVVLARTGANKVGAAKPVGVGLYWPGQDPPGRESRNCRSRVVLARTGPTRTAVPVGVGLYWPGQDPQGTAVPVGVGLYWPGQDPPGRDSYTCRSRVVLARTGQERTAAPAGVGLYWPGKDPPGRDRSHHVDESSRLAPHCNSTGHRLIFFVCTDVGEKKHLFMLVGIEFGLQRN